MRASLRPMAAAAVAAFLTRALFVLALGPDVKYAFTPDSTGYVQAASNIAERGVFSTSAAAPFIPDTVRTPGYPFFLALFCRPGLCPDARAALWAQAIVGTLAVLLTYGAALLLWRDERAALVAALGLALDPVTVFHTGLLLTETLFQSAFALGFFLLCAAYAAGPSPASRRWWASAGLLCGAAALVRPAGLYYFICASAALALGWLWERRPAAAWRGALAVFLAASCAVPALWIARNGERAGAWTFCSIQGLNFFGMRSAAVEMELTGLGYDQALAQIQSQLSKEKPLGFSSPAEESRYAGKWAARFLLRHPVAAFKVIAKDTVKMMGGHGLEIPAWIVLKDPAYDPLHPENGGGAFTGTRGLLRRHPAFKLALALSLVFLAAAYLLAARGFLAVWRAQRGAALLAASPIAYFLAVSAGALAYYRLRIPLMPAVFVLAGRGWTAVFGD